MSAPSGASSAVGRAVVVTLEWACEHLWHHLPWVVQARTPGPVCPLAHLAWRLDERWRTGVYPSNSVEAEASGCYGWPRSCEHLDDLDCMTAEEADRG